MISYLFQINNSFAMFNILSILFLRNIMLLRGQEDDQDLKFPFSHCPMVSKHTMEFVLNVLFIEHSHI